MSSVLRDKKGGTLLIVGATVGLAGVVLAAGGQLWGLALCAIGGAIEMSGPYLHDRHHRQRGEVSHALWGLDDRNKPRWLTRNR